MSLHDLLHSRDEPVGVMRALNSVPTEMHIREIACVRSIRRRLKF